MRLECLIKRQLTCLGKAGYFHFLFPACGLGDRMHPEGPITGRLTTGLLGYLCLQENINVVPQVPGCRLPLPQLNHQN